MRSTVRTNVAATLMAVALVACGGTTPASTPSRQPSRAIESNLAPTASRPAASRSATASPAAALTGLSGRFVFGGADGHLYLVDADGTNLRQLTNAPGNDFDPSFSPDGRSVVFRTSRGSYAADRSGTGTEGIFIVETERLSERQLFPASAAELGGLFPDWSPDGRRVALATVIEGKGEQVAVVDAASGRVVRILPTSGECLEWSPDGEHVSFCAHVPDSNNWDVFVMDVNGSNKRSVFATGDRDYGGLWSADGSELLVQSYVGEDRSDIWITPVARGKSRRLTTGPLSKAPDVWLPDGRILYEVWEPGATLPHWFVMNRDGSDPRPVGQLDAVGAIGPIDWAP